MKYSDNWPLIIDPQTQALTFIKNTETKVSDTNFEIIKPTIRLEKYLEFAVRMGKTLVINVGEHIDPVLDCVLIKNNIFYQAGSKVINIGN